MVEAKGWVQEPKETGEGLPAGRAGRGLSSGDKHWGPATCAGACPQGLRGPGARGADFSSVDLLPMLNPAILKTLLSEAAGCGGSDLERGSLVSRQVCRLWRPRDLGSNAALDSYQLGGLGPVS